MQPQPPLPVARVNVGMRVTGDELFRVAD